MEKQFADVMELLGGQGHALDKKVDKQFRVGRGAEGC